MKNEKVYEDILKMIDREERILNALNAVKQSIENDYDDCVVSYNLRRLISVYEESQVD